MTKIDFNSENYGHRLLLAQAMRDYARTSGRTLAGTKDGGEPSLLSALADAGIAMSKSNLDRIAAAGHPDDRERPYGNNARRVAQFLEEKGYFPPGQDPEDILKLLPVFFGSFSENGAALLRELVGSFHSYQSYEFAPELVVSGVLEIGEVTPWNYAPFREYIGSFHAHQHMMICEGVVFTDDQQNIYMIGRETLRKYPRFYVFEGIDRQDGKALSMISGMLLGSGLRTKRHLSSIALCPMSKEDSAVFEADTTCYLSDLPEYVAHYLSRTLAPGSENLRPSLTLAEIDERRKLATKRRRETYGSD